MSSAQAWALSLALHALLLMVLLGVARCVPDRPELLRWRVSLVDTPTPSVSVPDAPVAPPARAASPARPPAPSRKAEPVIARPEPPPQVAAAALPAPTEVGPPTTSSGPLATPTEAAPAGPPVSVPLAQAAALSPGGPPAAATAGPSTALPPAPVHAGAVGTAEKLWFAALVERLREQRRYPAMARRLRQEGVVAVQIVVEPDGSLRELTLLRGSGYPALDSAAQELVRQSADDVRDRLRPERTTRLEIPVAYRLRN